MKVSEVIEALQKMPQDFPVLVIDNAGNEHEVWGIVKSPELGEPGEPCVSIFWD